MACDSIRRLLKDGYPYEIIGNGGYHAVLAGIQPLAGHDYEAVYRYPGGSVCHDLRTVRECFTVVKQTPDD